MCDKKRNKWHKYSIKYSIRVETHTKTHISTQKYIQTHKAYRYTYSKRKQGKKGQKRTKKDKKASPEQARGGGRILDNSNKLDSFKKSLGDIYDLQYKSQDFCKVATSYNIQ